MLENGLDFCTCPKTNCERHGLCQQYLQYHAKKGKKPRCKRSNLKKEFHQSIGNEVSGDWW